MDFTFHQTFLDSELSTTEWNALLEKAVANVPFLRYEYLNCWWATRGGGEWPGANLALVTAREGGHLTGIAPLFSAINRDGEPALMLLGSIEISDYLDLIVEPADLKDFLSGLLDFLSSSPFLPAWCTLDWQNIPDNSPTLPILKSEAERRGWRFSQQKTYHAPAIPLPGDFDIYLASIDKKQRHEIRRKMRRLAESGWNFRWYIVDDASKLIGEVDAFLNLMADDPAKSKFLTDAMRDQMHLSCQAAFDNGWLQLAFLETDGQKAAGYLNFDYQNRIWVYNSGVNRRFLELSPGWVLLGYLLQWANENKREEFDFMRGEEDYKYRFGALDRSVMRVKITP